MQTTCDKLQLVLLAIMYIAGAILATPRSGHKTSLAGIQEIMMTDDENQTAAAAALYLQ